MILLGDAWLDGQLYAIKGGDIPSLLIGTVIWVLECREGNLNLRPRFVQEVPKSRNTELRHTVFCVA